MADESDVEIAMINLLSATLYPNGTSAGSATGVDCRIYRGWPNSAALDTDLRAGLVNVTVFPAPGAGRVTTRYLRRWDATQGTPTLTAAVTGTTVTFNGTAAVGQLAGLEVNGQTYVYAVTASDSPASVAANLGALARASTIVILSSSTLSIPGAWSLKARVVAQGQATSQIRRQTQSIRVTCWCPSPAIRDTTAIVIDLAFAQASFLSLPDGTQARMTYDGTIILDQSQDALLYRRDLMYSLDYPTIVSQTRPAMLWGGLGLAGAELPA